MPNKAVLVVDDDGDICDLYALMFETAGLSVRCVATGAEAVADERRPACVVLDWELPDGCGRDVAQALRDRWGSSLPIILITGAPLRMEDVAAADAKRCIGKPFEPDEVIQAVRDAVGRARPRRRRVSPPPSTLMRAS